jgi:hypothetical protein
VCVGGKKIVLMEERIAFLESALQKERERYSQLEEETDIRKYSYSLAMLTCFS